jgi:hypothetical protein
MMTVRQEDDKSRFKSATLDLHCAPKTRTEIRALCIKYISNLLRSEGDWISPGPKWGLARIDSTASTNIVCIANVCPETLIAAPKPERRTNVGFAGGAGAQFKIGSLAVRGEYERFNAAGGLARAGGTLIDRIGQQSAQYQASGSTKSPPYSGHSEPAVSYLRLD